MKKIIIFLAVVISAQYLQAQDQVFQTFKDRWVINSLSVETLPKYKLDARIAHRFGDFAGDAGGWPTFYGLENAADVSIGFEYGASDKLTLGFGRSKGSGQLRQLLNALVKYKIFSQENNGKPATLTFAGVGSLSTAQKSSDPSSMAYFEAFRHRAVYHGSLLLGRKFSKNFSLQLSAGITHRNVVPAGEENNIIHGGLATRVQVSKVLGIIGDFALPGTSDPERGNISYKAPIGIGFEFDTGGHVFQLNFTNASGLMPTDYIPYTSSDWLEGEFRLGFTISRVFNL